MARMARVWNQCAVQYTREGVAQQRLAGMSLKSAVGWLDFEILETQKLQRFKLEAFMAAGFHPIPVRRPSMRNREGTVTCRGLSTPGAAWNFPFDVAHRASNVFCVAGQFATRTFIQRWNSQFRRRDPLQQ
jgi:hypothetical protein